MEYVIEKNDIDNFDKLINKSRFNGSEITMLKLFYDKYINKYLKKTIDWKCPTCIRQVLFELQEFRKKSSIKDENKNNKRKSTKSGRKRSK